MDPAVVPASPQIDLYPGSGIRLDQAAGLASRAEAEGFGGCGRSRPRGCESSS